MHEAFSILGEVVRLARSPAALRARLAFARSRVSELRKDVEELTLALSKPDVKKAKKKRRKLKRKGNSLAFWRSRVTALKGRLEDAK